MGLRVALRGKVKPQGEAGAKASLKRAIVAWRRPETLAIYPWAGWRVGNTAWRTELTTVENVGDDLWIGVKG